MTPSESERTWAGNIKGLRASLRASEYTLLLEVSKQDLEGTWNLQKAQLHAVLLCAPVWRQPWGWTSPRLGEHPSVPLQHHWRTWGCLSTSQRAEPLLLDVGFPRLTLLIVQKIPHTTICKSQSISRNFKEWCWYGQGGAHPTQHKLQPPPLGCSRAKGSNRSCPAQLE